MTGRWRYVSHRLGGDRGKIAELPLSDVKATLLVNGAGSLTATLKLPAPVTPEKALRGRLFKDATVAAETVVYLFRDNTPIAAYILWDRRYDSAKQTMQLQGAELFSRWRRTIIEGEDLDDTVSLESANVGIALELLAMANDIGAVLEGDPLQGTGGIDPNAGLLFPSTEPGTRARTPDDPTLDFTNDFWGAVEVILPNGIPTSGDQTLWSKYVTTGNQRSYWLAFTSAGNLRFRTTTDGTSGTIGDYTATSVPIFGDRLAIGVHHAANNGAGGSTTDFYYGADRHSISEFPTTEIDFPGTRTNFNSTAELAIGSRDNGTASILLDNAIVTWAEFRANHRTGTMAASPFFYQQEAGTTTFDDQTGKQWDVFPDAEIVNDSDIRLINKTWKGTDGRVVADEVLELANSDFGFFLTSGIRSAADGSITRFLRLDHEQTNLVGAIGKYGTNVTKLEVSQRGDIRANDVIAVGTQQADAARASGRSTSMNWQPRMTEVVQHNNEDDPTELASLAASTRSAMNDNILHRLTVAEDFFDAQIGTFKPGGLIALDVPPGVDAWYPEGLRTTVRSVGIAISVPNTGGRETIDILVDENA